MSNALEVQIDGNHYKKLRLQPIELAYLVGGTPCFCKLAKYASRDKVDRSIDLRKALHCINLEKEIQEKYPALHEENYPVKTSAQLDSAKAWIAVFTEDELLRKSLLAMHGGLYSTAARYVEDMIEEYDGKKS